MTNLKITKLKLNDENEVELGPDDIVVFVGPNNVGKSQSLKDIHNLIGSSEEGVVIKGIETQINEKERIKSDIVDFSVLDTANRYKGYGFSIFASEVSQLETNESVGKNMVRFLTSFLSTEERLTLVTPPEKIKSTEPKQHPLHYLAADRQLVSKSDSAFYDAFGEHLQLNDYDGKYLSLVVGPPVEVKSGDVGQRLDKVTEFFIRKFDALPSLHEQGDGMKSFTGILLNLFVTHYSVFFIDEPESFLHPPQAYIMGKQLVELSNEKQLFLCTHSDSLLKGLLDTDSDRLKVIRVTRENDKNSFTILDNAQLKNMWKDPLLRYSNIMDALFYKTTVTCEGGADCKFYKAILDSVLTEKGIRKDVHFVETGGKNRFWIVAKALKGMNIDFRLTPDFDIYAQESDAKKLYEECGGNWDAECRTDWQTMEGSLPNVANPLERDEVKRKIVEYLDGLPDQRLSDHPHIETLKSYLKGNDKWSEPKHKGLDGVPEGAGREAARRLIESFNKKSIFPVPYGEMESLNPIGKKHGKDWVTAMLTQYQDLSDHIYDKVKDYIKSLNV